jgi:transposase
LESLRPDVVEKRAAFLRRVRRIRPEKLVFLDESGLHLSMSRSHAWVKRGEEFIDRVPINRGKHGLTLMGAIRLAGWVVLSTTYEATTKVRFLRWLTRRLLPKLQAGDVLIMDNLSAHHDARVTAVCGECGVRVLYLPPYSPDFNPIEPAWALQKQHVRRYAPRDSATLRRVARRARFRVKLRHCRGWFSHCGYRVE